MQKEQLTKQLIGAIVTNPTKGQGVVIDAEARQNNVLIVVQFDKDKITYSVFAAVGNKAIDFLDDTFCGIVNMLKAIYAASKKPETFKNRDVDLLVEQLKSGQSITHSLIRLYNNSEFETELVSLGTEYFFQRMKGQWLNVDKLYVMILYMSYIALKEYDRDFHGKLFDSISKRLNCYVDDNLIRRIMYDTIIALKLREKVKYFDPKSYVAVPISIACVPHYRVGQLFRIAYDIYKKKLLFDEDVTDQQIKEKVSDALAALKRKKYISDAAEDVIKGTEYLMSKYTQSCILSEFNIEALIEILTNLIRLIINYLTKQEDAYAVLEFYKDGFAEWIASFENDSTEKEVYLKNRSLSRPSLSMNSRHEIILKTGAYCMDDIFDPYKIFICIYNNESLIQNHRLDGANDIEYNNEAIGGYKINSKRFFLSNDCSPIGRLSYKIFCDDRLLYDSQERLYREVLFFCAKDGTEAKPGTDHIGEELIIVSKQDNSDNYGDKLTIIHKRKQYIISQMIIENGNSYMFDGNPYVFRKVKDLELFGYQVPWIRFLSMEKKLYSIYKNAAVLLPASCDKEDVQVELDGNILNFYNKDYRIYKYSQNNDGTFVYLVKVLCAEPGYHQIEFINTITNRSIGKKKLTFVFDGELQKENLSFQNDGQSFDLVSSFLRSKIAVIYPYGTTFVKAKAYVPNLGHGELNLLPSTPSYSVEGVNWVDIYKNPLSLYDIPSEQRHIYVCGPDCISFFYASDKKSRRRLDFEQTEDNIYKVSLSYIRSLDDKIGNICFDYGNYSKLLRVYRFPWVSDIECAPSIDGQYYQACAKFTSTSTMWMVIKSSVCEKILLEREIRSDEPVLLDRHLVEENVWFITVGIHSRGTSLFKKYNTEPLKIIRYVIPYDITIKNESRISYNAEEKKITANIFFAGADKIKVSVYPVGLDILLYETIVRPEEEVTIDVGHELFACYNFIFKSITNPSSRINKSQCRVNASSKYLRKTFNIEQFIFENGSIKNVSGLQFRFSARYLLNDNSIYAVGEIITQYNQFDRKAILSKPALLKMSLIPKEDGVFEIYIYKDSDADKWELKKYQIKGASLNKIKIRENV